MPVVKRLFLGIIIIWGRTVTIQRNAFATWLNTLMEQNKISNTKLAAAPGIEMTAPAVIKWRTGESIPRDDETIDAIADFFGADRSYVRMLAGRGQLGMSEIQLSPDMIEIALELQERLAKIKDPEARELARQNLISSIGAWTDSIERLADFLETITPKGS